jgi:hypothetical protein
MYPIVYEADFNPEPNRWTTFFRPLLAIPWLIVGYVYVIAAVFTHLFAWVAVVILGRYPQWLYNFNSGVIRFFTRVYAWEYLQTDAWPPFGIADDPAYPIRLKIAPAAERQSRLKAFFRIVLALPALVVLYAVGLIQAGLAIVAWLTIVFRGYLPEAVYNGMTFVNGLSARVSGYVMLLTDDYPPIGIERAKPTAPAAPAAPLA